MRPYSLWVLGALALSVAVTNAQFKFGQQPIGTSGFQNPGGEGAQTGGSRGGGGSRRQGQQQAQQGGQQQQERPQFDLDKDVAPILVSQMMGDAVRAAVSPFASDASLVIRITVLMSNAFFDANAPYTPAAVGIYSNLGRRPSHEWTHRNKNIAVFYCSMRVLGNAIPDQALRFVDMLQDVGLDPSDTHESQHDPIGIGNLCGRGINNFRDNDGQNSKGDIGATSPYNHKPFNDYTNYKPVNPYDKIVDPRRWQPNVNDLNGVFTIQKFVTPQHGFTKAYSYDDVNQFVSKPHGRLLEGAQGKDLYKRTTDEVIAISAALTDEQKMAAEFFDDKLLSFGYTTFGVYETRNLTYDEFVYYELMVNLAQFDATIAIWKEKARWDAVRPFTAIPYLYGDQKITAYCGKGQGTCNDIPANDWTSYMPVADHPEYPSLTAAVCAAYSEASRDFLGNDQTGLEPVPFIQGNSRREFGITPSRNTSINIDTWTEFELTCGSSRLWGGVHFVDAVEEGNRIGNEIGKIAVDFVRGKINPQSPPEGPVVGPLARQKSEPLRQAPAAAQPTAAAPTQVPTGPAFAQSHSLPASVTAYHQALSPAVPHQAFAPVAPTQYPGPYHYPTVATVASPAFAHTYQYPGKK